MITHSQGNFYGNAIFNDIYASYHFPNGYAIAQYPMLGNMQIASPVYQPGSAASSIFPDAVGHITNDTDLVMLMVRGIFGAVPPNFESPYNPADASGHGLEASYLAPTWQAHAIAEQMNRIADKLVPYPLHGQVGSSSSAISGFGHSQISAVLDIEFTSGGVYRYSNVSEQIFQNLASAPSQGAYFNEWIRDRYDYTRLD